MKKQHTLSGLMGELMNGEPKKPYVLIMLTHDHKKRYALDRGYNWMKDITDEEIDSCFIKDIVQVMKGRLSTFEYPDWVKNYLQDDFNIEEDPFISIWFNYYD